MGINVQAITDFGIKMIIFGIAIALLPESPFNLYLGLMDDIPFLQYINWFIPIDGIIAVMETWLQVILLIYAYKAIHNYSGVIGG